MSASEPRVTCTDFAGDPEKPQCCGSCHDDSDMGYESYECLLNDGRLFIGCCKVAEWLDKRETS